MINRKILKRKVKFLTDPVKSYKTNAHFKRGILYSRYYENTKVDNKAILYESRDGNSISDNPFAIFNYLLQKEGFQDYKHIWSVHDKESLKEIISLYSSFDNVIFVQRNSNEYLKYLCSSKYLINNSTFQSFFTPKESQVYINTWHGTPLKKMGYDIPGNPSGPQNVVRNFLSADYLISPNEHTTSMYLESFKLDGLYNGEIIQDGYPRIDLTIKSDPKVITSRLTSIGIKIAETKQTLLYAPTWKGTSTVSPKNETENIFKDIKILEDKLGNKYNILVKVHPYLFSKASNDVELSQYLIPDYFDTNQLLSSVDILVTDYSSIFFDFLVTGKPILFYMHDEEDYKKNRETYFENEDLPGPILNTIDDLCETVLSISNVFSKFKHKYSLCKEKFCYFDDGHVTERIVNYIFLGKENNKTLKGFDRNKEKIVLYPGGMKNNGITSSLLNLLDNIDYDKYDVTLFTNASKSKDVLSNMNKVNKNVRFLFKVGYPIYNLNETYRDRVVKNRGLFRKTEKLLYPQKAYQKEVSRLFGKSKFDFAIDFSGYSYYWAKYIVNIDAKKKICYLHSDMLADSEKIINGRKPHKQNLRGIFSIYDKFDKLTSVSRGTLEVNKKNLSVYGKENSFDFTMNSLNFRKVLDSSRMDIENVKFPLPQKNNVNFIAMGRLSPEKGYDNLLHAFATFHKNNPKSSLYIVGDGALKKMLKKLINKLDLNNSVFLTGQLENPFSLMNMCDCFILSSHYEGQPMVLLEALTLKMNIIATDIVANRYLLEDGKYGLLVENSVDGLNAGMTDFILNGKVTHSTDFDYIKYNEEAIQSLYKHFT